MLQLAFHGSQAAIQVLTIVKQRRIHRPPLVSLGRNSSRGRHLTVPGAVHCGANTHTPTPTDIVHASTLPQGLLWVSWVVLALQTRR